MNVAIVVSSSGTVDGYDAQTGTLLWSHEGLAGNSISSVTAQGEMVFVGAGVQQQENHHQTECHPQRDPQHLPHESASTNLTILSP